MTNGTNCSADDLAVPKEWIDKDAIGTTGMWGDRITPEGSFSVIRYLENLPWDPYQFDFWDCEDRAFWGIANARCQFKGIPMGAAIGTAIEGNFPDKSNIGHALIVFWKQVEDTFQPVYFDPAEGLRREVQFDPKIIIPFPIYRPNDNKSVRRELPPFENVPYIQEGCFALDNDYSIIDIAPIEAYLTSFTRCIDSPDPLVYRFREDRAFWAFIHACRQFKGSPIGFAVGKATQGKFQGKDNGVVVLWKDCDTYVFWDVDDNKEVSFEPRIVIV